jgi:Predicted membrane protein
MLIVCCAADARPIAVSVQAQKEVSAADMSWVKVIGTAEFQESGGGKAKVTFKAAEIEPTDPPQDAMLY